MDLYKSHSVGRIASFLELTIKTDPPDISYITQINGTLAADGRDGSIELCHILYHTD